ncbi:MAG: NAD-binding protein, partial [Firmicutes bacterium]|nr:NAD-binding protein [Bacillota bacterium]
MNIAIVGVGKLGVKVCETLAEGDYAITLVDMNAELLDKLSQQFDVMTVNEDGRDIGVLKEIEIGNYDYVIAASGSDETNMIVGRFAKELGARCVIARVRDPEYMNHFAFIKRTMGIDFVVNPDFAITTEIYKYLTDKSNTSNNIFTSGRITLLEFSASQKSELIGKSMPEVKTMMPNMLIAAISRNGKVIIPHGEDIIQSDDSVYVVGEVS